MRIYTSVDPMTGTASYVDYDEGADALHFTEQYDASALIEWNKRLYNEAPSGWGEGATAARLPLMLWLKLKREGIIDDRKRWKAWLNDPDNRHFRCRPGWI